METQETKTQKSSIHVTTIHQAPTENYELVPVLGLNATKKIDENFITVSAYILVNSSHGIEPTEPKPIEPEPIEPSIEAKIINHSSQRDNLVLDFVFKKNPTASLTNCFNYFKISFDITEDALKARCLDITDIKKITLHLKSNNPRTSRGTVTTVKNASGN